MRMPEVDEPVTRGRVVVDRGEQKDGGPANALHAFSQGALFGLVVAGQILWVKSGFKICTSADGHSSGPMC
jgi:CNT family concentrative nucleoside transporter